MIVENVILAFAEITNVTTLTLMMVGVAAGLLAGAIPGFTIAMAIVLTLPFTFGMPPSQGLATMVSVLVGGPRGCRTPWNPCPPRPCWPWAAG